MLWLCMLTLASLALVGGDITGQSPRPGQCLCFNNSGVRVRSTACGAIIGSSSSGQCFRARGQKQRCSLSGRSYEFHSFNYNGRTGWSAGNFLNMASSARCAAPPGGNCGGATIVSRAGWGARPPRNRGLIRGPVNMVFIHHTAGAPCTSRATCISRVRATQRYHMDSRGYSDIGYSWLVGEDGSVYEGRGWGVVGAHTRGYNSVAYAVCVIGNYMSRLPNARALAAVRNIISCGVAQGRINAAYELRGHRDGGCTACPGNSLYAHIRTWPRYSTRRIPRYC